MNQADRTALPETRLDEMERDALHSLRLGITVTFAVVEEQLELVEELRRLRARVAGLEASLATARRSQHTHHAVAEPAQQRAPIEVEVVITHRDANGRELGRVRRSMPLEPEDRYLRAD
jgi:hypothetical protein